jgi:DNA-binding NarL/FixJ family response regulator
VMEAVARETGLPDPQPIRILVVDDHRSFSESLQMAIDLMADLECVGIASTVNEAVAMVEEHRPDVVLMDVRLPDGDGIDGTRRVKQVHPQARVVVLTAHTDPELMAAAASLGACGFLPKERSLHEILHAVRTAGDGGMLVEPSALASVLSRLNDREDEEVLAAAGVAPKLTPREFEVLQLIAEGRDPRGIATHLGLSIHTSRGYVKAILAKFGVHSQLEALVYALRNGIL